MNKADSRILRYSSETQSYLRKVSYSDLTHAYPQNAASTRMNGISNMLWR